MMQTSPDNSSESAVDRSPISAGTPNAIYNLPMRKLLHVDDEADGADFAAVLLRSHGLEVVVVHSASDALEILRKQRDIDIVLSDIMMPGMTGLQLAENIQLMYPSIKIVLMSGYVLPELLRNRERDYLFVEKPYKMDTLLKVLRS
ncbi:response regulator [Massilia sp. X63]|uniref:response regulator n=1 Tax=Massilia sp. X63 TaxID=3237285 RepID=UPI0034DD6FA4